QSVVFTARSVRRESTRGVRAIVSSHGIALPRRDVGTERGKPKRLAALTLALAASASRSRGGAFVTREVRSSWAAWATSATARLNASSFAFDGRVKPLSFRTN